MLVFKNYIPESPKWLLSQKDSDADGNIENPLQSDGISSRGSNVSRVHEISKDKYDQVHNVLKSLRSEGYDVDAEIRLMLTEMNQNKDKADDVTWSEVFQCRTGVIIGCGLMFFQVNNLCIIRICREILPSCFRRR
jgi:uncharacterized protein (UPF0335 family)